MPRRKRDRIHRWIYIVDAVVPGIFFYAALTSAFTDGGFPEFDNDPNNVTFNVGETATLPCHVVNLQTRYLYWMRMSEPNPITVGTFVYSPDTRFSVRKDPTSTHWDLRIRNVKPEDAGVYFCAVSSGESREKYRRLIKLNVKEVTTIPPGIILNGSEFVNKGDPLVLECLATGFNQMSDYLEWYKDGKIIDNGYIWKHHRLRGRAMNITDFHFIETKTLKRVLYIARVTMEDSGTYMCRISDDIAKKTVHVLDEGSSSIDKRETYNSGNSIEVPWAVRIMTFIMEEVAIVIFCHLQVT
ncbi:lachesin-like isoform X2 [Saccostrea echinata]|uniref:lachesin-like isoform X2 n=1 Tax=Saccostrea echinata TaxID=191078 RepID=UPI002A80A3E9|nr:lachesin-like isoform X2 [Saccostrea echinata]